MIQPTKENFEAAKKGLIADGYEHICTVMSGDKGLNYGTQFVHPTSHEVLWLNKDTLGSILFRLAENKLKKHGYKDSGLCYGSAIENTVYEHESKPSIWLDAESVPIILAISL